MAKILNVTPASPADFGFGNIDNPGANPLSVKSFTISAPGTNSGSINITAFAITASSSGANFTTTSGTWTLAPGTTINWGVSFNPTTIGSKTGNFRITSDADNPIINITLDGSGHADFKRVIARFDNEKYSAKIYHWVAGAIEKDSELDVICGLFGKGLVESFETDPESFDIVSASVKCSLFQVPNYSNIFRMANTNNGNVDEGWWDANNGKKTLYLEINYLTESIVHRYRLKPNRYKKSFNPKTGIFVINLFFFDGLTSLSTFKRRNPDDSAYTTEWIWRSGTKYKIIDIIKTISEYVSTEDTLGSVNVFHPWYWHNNIAPTVVNARFSDLWIDGYYLDSYSDGISLIKSLCQAFYCTFGMRSETEPYFCFRNNNTGLITLDKLIRDDIVIDCFIPAYIGLLLTGIATNANITKGIVYLNGNNISYPNLEKLLSCDWQSVDDVGGSYVNFEAAVHWIRFASETAGSTQMPHQNLVAETWWNWYQKNQLKLSASAPTFAHGDPVEINGFYAPVIDGESYNCRPYKIERDLDDFTDKFDFVTTEN